MYSICNSLCFKCVCASYLVAHCFPVFSVRGFGDVFGRAHIDPGGLAGRGRRGSCCLFDILEEICH